MLLLNTSIFICCIPVSNGYEFAIIISIELKQTKLLQYPDMSLFSFLQNNMGNKVKIVIENVRVFVS